MWLENEKRKKYGSQYFIKIVQSEKTMGKYHLEPRETLCPVLIIWPILWPSCHILKKGRNNVLISYFLNRKFKRIKDFGARHFSKFLRHRSNSSEKTLIRSIFWSFYKKYWNWSKFQNAYGTPKRYEQNFRCFDRSFLRKKFPFINYSF